MGDALVSHDLAAVAGRIAGWRAAHGLKRRETPTEALAREIGMRESLALRRGIYAPKTSA